MRLLICGGGTAGHIMPAVAVVEQLRQAQPSISVLALASKRQLDQKLYSRHGIECLQLNSAPIAGVSAWEASVNAIRNASAFLAALAMARTFSPTVALSTGGYPSVPGALATRALGRPMVLLAVDEHPGLAVRTQAKFASRIACATPATALRLGAGKSQPTGLPLRLQFDHPNAEAARNRFGVPSGRSLVVVVGGSQGARVINEAVIANMERLLDLAHVVHLTGNAGVKDAIGARARLTPDEAERYRPVEFLNCEYADLLAAADLVVGRAGAGAVAELASSGRPALLVPGQFAAGHQMVNAARYAASGAAIVLAEEDLKRLPDTIGELLTDRPLLAQMAAAAHSQATPGAAAAVAEMLREIAA